MENLTYITSNYGKYIATKEKFERAGIVIENLKIIGLKSQKLSE